MDEQIQKVFGTKLQTSQGEILIKELRTVDLIEFLKEWKNLAEQFSFGSAYAIFVEILPKIIEPSDKAQYLYMSEIDKIEVVFKRINSPLFRHSAWAIKSAFRYGMGQILETMAEMATRDFCAGMKKIDLKKLLKQAGTEIQDNLNEQDKQLSAEDNISEQEEFPNESQKIQVKIPQTQPQKELTG